MRTIPKKTLVAVCVFVFLCSLALAAASYLMTSNTVNTTPTAKATLVLTQDNANPIVGVDTVHYTATCSDTSFNGVVTFKDGTTTLGTATATGGVAVLSYTPTSTTPLAVTATATHS